MASEIILRITRGFFVAAVYFVLAMVFEPIHFEFLQFRIAESLALLPFLWPEAVPGLFLGSLVANYYTGTGMMDLTLASTATLFAAILTGFAKNYLLAALAPVAVNGLILGLCMSYVTGIPKLTSILYAAAGEAVVCFTLGIPIISLLGLIRVTEKQ